MHASIISLSLAMHFL